MFLSLALTALIVTQDCDNHRKRSSQPTKEFVKSGSCPCGPDCKCIDCKCIAPVGALSPEQEAKIAIEQAKLKILIDSLKKPTVQAPIKSKTYHLEQRCGPNGCYQVWVED